MDKGIKKDHRFLKPTFQDRAKGGKTRYPDEMKQEARRLKVQGMKYEDIKRTLIDKWGKFPSKVQYWKWIKGAQAKPVYATRTRAKEFNKTLGELREAVSHKNLGSDLPEETVLVLQYLDDLAETAYYESKHLAWRDKGQASKALTDVIQLKVSITKDLTNQKLIKSFLGVVVKLLNTYVPEKALAIQNALVPEVLGVLQKHMGLETVVQEADILEEKIPNAIGP